MKFIRQTGDDEYEFTYAGALIWVTGAVFVFIAMICATVLIYGH